MSNQKIKQENYTTFGGMNSKFSPYTTSPMEFLYLENYDFQTPGALTQRWGSTMYIGQTFPNRITFLSEYAKLNGFSQILVGTSAGLWAGATTGQLQGMSFTLLSAPAGFSLANNYSPQKISSNPAVISTPVTFLYGSINLPYQLSYLPTTGVSLFTYNTEIVSSGFASVAYIVDHAFIADGNKFVKYNGVTCTPVGLPMVIPSNAANARATSTLVAPQVGYGGSFVDKAVFYLSYVNTRGFEGRAAPIVQIDGGKFISGATNLLNFYSVTLTVSTPMELGISSINVYGYVPPQSWTLVAGTSILLDPIGSTLAWSYPYLYLGNYPASGSTTTDIPIGTSLGGISAMFAGAFPLASQVNNSYITLGETFATFGSVIGTATAHLTDFRYYPQFIEAYQNRLFCAGFSAAPSLVHYSESGEPEGYAADANFEVRTNDSDVITCMRAYQTRLYIFKLNSFHSLFGDNPNNFYLQEISNIYGCLNNRSSLIFNNTLIFLDRKGVMDFEGSQVSCISTKVQSFFDNMDYDAATVNSCMIHDKLRNQILVAIPCKLFPLDSQKNNNVTIVYDYVSNAWTTHRGYNPTAFAIAKGYSQTKSVFYGNSSGMINWQGPSFLTDNGVGFTLKMETRFVHDMGDSTQKQYRRLYLNSNYSGTTLVFQADFLQDYGTSTVYSATIYLSQFQNRIDYGISCKSIAFVLYNINNSGSPLALFGFTLESRLQRRV
jgi:hypothetical protein